MRTRFIYDANGNPFHLEGTKIWRTADGTLMFRCPSPRCGEKPVPARLIRELAKYARNS